MRALLQRCAMRISALVLTTLARIGLLRTWVLATTRPLDWVLRAVLSTTVLSDAAPRFPGCPIPSRYLATASQTAHPAEPADGSLAVLYLHGGWFSVHTPMEHACAARLLPLLDGSPDDKVFLAVGYTLQPSASHAEQIAQALECLRSLARKPRVTSIVVAG
eukprot:6125692-Prymnesium_polylepis.2